MYFFEFLLEKKIVKKEQLIDAFVYQVENLPSLLRVMRDEKILDADQLFQILSRQLSHKEDFLTALNNSKLLSPDEIEKVLDLQSKSFLSFGQILTDLKFIDATSYQEIVEGYIKSQGTNLKNDIVSDTVDPSLNSQSNVEDNKISTSDEESDLVNKAALESLKELFGSGAVQSDEVKNLIEDEISHGQEVQKQTEISKKENLIGDIHEGTSNEEEVVSSAALESLKELMASGGVASTEASELVNSKSMTSINEEVLEEPKSSPNKISTEKAMEEVDQKENLVSDAALESLKELIQKGGVSSDESIELLKNPEVNEESKNKDSPVERFTQAYTDTKLKKMMKIIKFIEDSLASESDTSNILNSLYFEMTPFKDMTLDTVIISKIVDSYLLLLVEILKLNKELFLKWYELEGSILKAVPQFLEELKNELLKNDFNEKQLWNDEKFKLKYSKIYRKIKIGHNEAMEIK